jgi:hypothetical protein
MWRGVLHQSIYRNYKLWKLDDVIFYIGRRIKGKKEEG